MNIEVKSLSPTTRLFLTAIFLLFLLAPAGPAAAQACGADPISFPSASSCSKEPDSYTVTIYELGLCTSTPTVPTSSVAYSTAGCEKVFESTAGTSVTITPSSSSSLTGGVITIPAAGSYAYGYAVISNLFRIKSTVTFDSSQTGGSGSGSICWTTDTSELVSTGVVSGAYSECGSAEGTQGTIYSTVDSFTPISNGGPDYIGSDSTSVGSLTAYILGTGDVLATSYGAGASSQIFGLMTFSTPVTVPAEPKAFTTLFKSSTGMTVSDNGSGGVAFSGGPFSMKISVY
jgi:hypothetical protein